MQPHLGSRILERIDINSSYLTAVILQKTMVEEAWWGILYLTKDRKQRAETVGAGTRYPESCASGSSSFCWAQKYHHWEVDMQSPQPLVGTTQI